MRLMILFFWFTLLATRACAGGMWYLGDMLAIAFSDSTLQPQATTQPVGRDEAKVKLLAPTPPQKRPADQPIVRTATAEKGKKSK